MDSIPRCLGGHPNLLDVPIVSCSHWSGFLEGWYFSISDLSTLWEGHILCSRALRQIKCPQYKTQYKSSPKGPQIFSVAFILFLQKKKYMNTLGVEGKFCFYIYNCTTRNKYQCLKCKMCPACTPLLPSSNSNLLTLSSSATWNYKVLVICSFFLTSHAIGNTIRNLQSWKPAEPIPKQINSKIYTHWLSQPQNMDFHCMIQLSPDINPESVLGIRWGINSFIQ